ncbi:hypothetical protein ACFO4O_15280 [Glaciecola siphonariae]|uniref:Uncharacterized protein n=1 Tax=Glaciecola siphonariae TaxID=521012 RepID=A0ABV9M1F0_9ALTE
MKYFLVITFMIKAKLFYIALSIIFGGIAMYLTGDEAVGIIFATSFFVGIYFWLIGPVNFAEKKAINKLVDDGIATKTNISPLFCSDNDLTLMQDKWVIGVGVIDRFSKVYCVNYNADGLLFHNKDTPYLPICLIKWQNITSILESSKDAIENGSHGIKHSKSIVLVNGKSITLPINDKIKKYFDAHNNS